MGGRILPGSSLLGSQTLVVDPQGNGDYRRIQEALNAAAAFATASSRWNVRLAPGSYDEQLTLKDYVDLIGLAPGRAAHLKRPSGRLILSPANCTLANLWLESVDQAVVYLPSSFSGVLEMQSVWIDQTALDIPSLDLNGGTLRLNGCLLASGGTVQVSDGSLEINYSLVRNQAGEDGGENMAIYLSGGQGVILRHSLVENTSPAGYALFIDGAVSSLHAHHCTFRTKDSTYAIEASLSQAMILSACTGNAPLHPNLTGYHGYTWDSSV